MADAVEAKGAGVWDQCHGADCNMAICASAGPMEKRCGLIMLARRYFASSKIIAAPFSAIIAVGVLVLPDVMVGMIEASTMRKPPRP